MCSRAGLPKLWVATLSGSPNVSFCKLYKKIKSGPAVNLFLLHLGAIPCFTLSVVYNCQSFQIIKQEQYVIGCYVMVILSRTCGLVGRVLAYGIHT